MLHSVALTESLNGDTFVFKMSLLCSTDPTIVHCLQEPCANSLQPTMALNSQLQQPCTPLATTHHNCSYGWKMITRCFSKRKPCCSWLWKEMHICLNAITSKFIIWWLILIFAFLLLRESSLVWLHLQRCQESSPLIAFFFHLFLHFPLCFVSVSWYLYICLKSKHRCCSSAHGWAVPLCKLVQKSFKVYLFLNKVQYRLLPLPSHSNTQINNRSHEPQAPY